MAGERDAPAPLHPENGFSTQCTGGWVGPSVCLDVCGKASRKIHVIRHN
jgi:hypothetical protein